MSESKRLTRILSLSAARKSGRLQEFIEQSESSELSVASEHGFNSLIDEAVTPHQSADQTSGSRARGGSRGK